MRFMFIVQTEGRGHLSQALALADILESHDHEVVSILIGQSKRVVPDYFLNRFASKIQYFNSPNFSYDKNNQGLNLFKTFINNIIQTPVFLKSLFLVRKLMKQDDVDFVINFYDLIGALAHMGLRRSHKYLVVSHHFYLTHPDHNHITGRLFETYLLKSLNRILAIKADKIWALSFREGESSKNVIIMPPLISKEILEASTGTSNYILAYSVNKGYSEQIKAWQLNNPEVVIHYFWDGFQESPSEEVQKNLFFHQLDRTLFQEYLINCRAYVSTAGFESVCEAIYLSKPIFLVPVKQHLEQYNNAIDALKTGNCMLGSSFDLDEFMKFIEGDYTNELFKTWVKSGPKRFLDELDL